MSVSLADRVRIEHSRFPRDARGVVVSLNWESALVEWNDSQLNGWYKRNILIREVK